MSVVNLNKARKAKARADKKSRAQENAVKYGRTQSEKRAEAQQSAKVKRHLDQHKKDE